MSQVDTGIILPETEEDVQSMSDINDTKNKQHRHIKDIFSDSSSRPTLRVNTKIISQGDATTRPPKSPLRPHTPTAFRSLKLSNHHTYSPSTLTQTYSPSIFANHHNTFSPSSIQHRDKNNLFSPTSNYVFPHHTNPSIRSQRRPSVPLISTFIPETIPEITFRNHRRRSNSTSSLSSRSNNTSSPFSSHKMTPQTPLTPSFHEGRRKTIDHGVMPHFPPRATGRKFSLASSSAAAAAAASMMQQQNRKDEDDCNHSCDGRKIDLEDEYGNLITQYVSLPPF